VWYVACSIEGSANDAAVEAGPVTFGILRDHAATRTSGPRYREVASNAVTYDRETSTYTLKSGRVIRASAGILGLGYEDATLYEGWSGKCLEGPQGSGDEEGSSHELTPDERYEIGSEMVHRWLRWAEGEAADAGRGGA
jgi:hypothetical protein